MKTLLLIWAALVPAFLFLPFALFGQVRIESVTVTTNRPAIDFTAATPLGSFPATAYWHGSNDCGSVTLTFTGPPAVYDVQWNYALGNPRFTTNGGALAIEGHAFVNVYPPVTNFTGTVTVTLPAKPSATSYWRLKQR